MNTSQIVSITSQGQLTIPKSILKEFDIENGAKAILRKEGKMIIVEPKKNFWSLHGSLRSKIVLTDRQLKQARNDFAQKWGKHE